MAWFRAACEVKVAVKRTSLRSPLSATSRHVRYVHIIPRSHSTPILPWERPDSDGKFVTHFDASPDMKGKSGGGIGSVTRNRQGVVVDKAHKFITGVIDPTQLDLLAFKEFTSMRPKFMGHHTLISDNSASVYCLYAQANLHRPVKSESLKNLATIVLKQLEENFPPDTLIKWVPRHANNLADSMAQFARWEHLDKVASVIEACHESIREAEEEFDDATEVVIPKKEEPALSRARNRPKRDV